jgi:hypothetical protein
LLRHSVPRNDTQLDTFVLFQDQLIADTVDGDDMARPGRVVLELCPEQGDMIIDGPGRGVLVITPDGIQQLIPGDHLARAGR